MPTPDPELDEITQGTLSSYEERADSFWQGTRGHDVSQNLDALLAAIPGEGPHRILDFGCGPGRDIAELQRRGHEPVGLDGAESFVRMAREATGATVWRQNFLALDLPANHFAGVFANASLFHVPVSELPRVLSQLFACLAPGGILFSSNPRGDNREGWNGDRYGAYHDFEAWSRFVGAAGFEAVEHYYRPPGLPREEQPWLASVWRKPAGGER